MTKFLIITSTEDKASMNIRENFLNDTLLKFKELDFKWHDNHLLELEIVVAKRDWGPFFSKNQFFLGLTDDPLIHLNDLRLNEAEFEPDLLIFASRHRSEAARTAFLTHTTGNWGAEAKYGGNPHAISNSSALLIKAAYVALGQQKIVKELGDFEVDIEVTHHGPTTLEKPLVFMELGSGESEWEIKKAGLAVAHSVLDACFYYSDYQEKKFPHIGIGFGGTHYAPQFKKLIDIKNVAMSFICPKYYIQDLDKKIVESMINNTLEKVDSFIIDWKGTNSADKQHLIPILEEFDIPYVKSKDL